MARRKAGPGHNNPPLAPDERAPVQRFYENKVRGLRRDLEAAMLAVKEVRDDINSTYKMIDVDLSVTRKRFERYLERADMSAADYERDVNADAQLDVNGGLRSGEQQTLFKIGDTADDAAEAALNGYRAGLRGDDPKPPKTVHPSFHQEWLKEWHRGQKETQDDVQKGMEIINARKAPKAQVTGDPDPPKEEGEEGDGDAVAEEAARLKASGWAEPGAEGVEAKVEESEEA